jgi:hypothetical protein
MKKPSRGGGEKVAKEKVATLSPWVLILLTAPLPFLVLGYVGYQWHSKTTSLGRVEEQFLDRQNTVLAYDATRIAERVSELLDQAAIDVQTLGSLPTKQARERFVQLQTYNGLGGGVRRSGSEFPMPLPSLRYNRALILSLNSSDFEWYWEADTKAPRLKGITDCSVLELCDRNLLESIAKLSSGELLYGKALRIYTPKGTSPNDSRAGLSVAYRLGSKIFLLSLDYRHLWHLLSIPSFPYASKRDWLRSYEDGNYLYLVDRASDMLVHPKFWHVAGIDSRTGLPVPPMKVDADEGQHPLNLLAYRTGNLRAYFDRLLNESFPRNSVDIFEGRNLGGTSRVLSVVPVLLNRGQFLKSGLFGHVVVGCSLEYFQEPKEKRLPYY